MSIKEVTMGRIVGTIYKETYDYFMENYKDILVDNDIDFRFVDRKDRSSAEPIELLISGTMMNKQYDMYPNLTDIFVPYTGLNGLNLKMLQDNDVRVYNTNAHGKFVAERALALLLGIKGKIIRFNSHLQQGDWCKIEDSNQRESWDSIFDKKVAVYGYGMIGYQFHCMVKPFNCQVGALNYKGRYLEGVKQFDNLEDLAQWCDIMVVTVPLNDATRDSVGQEVLDHLKGKVLINVGRGEIINEDALYHSVLKGDLLGFGSDVWYQYPKANEDIKQPSKYDFSSYEQVIMTPHNAGLEKSSASVRNQDVLNQLLKIVHGDYSTQIQ